MGGAVVIHFHQGKDVVRVNTQRYTVWHDLVSEQNCLPFTIKAFTISPQLCCDSDAICLPNQSLLLFITQHGRNHGNHMVPNNIVLVTFSEEIKCYCDKSPLLCVTGQRILSVFPQMRRDETRLLSETSTRNETAAQPFIWPGEH